MQAQELIAMLQSCPPEAEVLIRYFGDVEADKDDTFEDLAHTEITTINGKDAFTIAGY